MEKEPIRILRVIARLNIGGPAIQAISLSDLFSRGRFRTRLVCGQVGTHEGDMSYLATSRQVDPVALPTLGRELSFFDDLRSFSELRKIISEFTPHIIHTHTAKAGFLGRLAGIRANARGIFGPKIKLVHTFHGHVFHSYFSSLKTSAFIQIERFLARFTDRIIAISPSQKRDICEIYKIARSERVQVVPLGFDLSSFERLGPPTAQGVFSVGIIGRLTPVKNHRMLLATAKLLKDREQDSLFRFFVVGDGELKEDLTREVARLGIEKEVVFTGWQRDMAEVYQKLDAVVLTSLNEGTPVSLIEAMAAARPVIATDVGGVRDLMGEINPSRELKTFSGSTLRDPRAEARGSRWVDTETGQGYKLARHGVLVSSGDSKALAEALLFVVREKTLAFEMAEQARNHVLQTYSLERLVRDMAAFYEGLLSL
jgi:glycosyltransferase involved in cell wall biosynthesis